MIKMKNLYYQIWADAIVYEKTNFGHMRNWKVYTLLPISFFQGINLWTIIMGLITFNVKVDAFFDFDVFPGTMFDKFLSVFITLFLPFLILNYLLIFRNKQYEKIITKYEYKKGRFYILYLIISGCIILLPLIIAVSFFQ